MSRIFKSIKALGQIIRNPWLLNKILNDDRNWKHFAKKWPGMENGLPVIQPDELFGDFNETVEPFAFLDGGSLPTDLALLKKLARRIPDCNYFEIGTWRGESVANVAAVAKSCFTLNLSKGEMKAMGLDQRYIDLHGHYSRNIPHVIHLEGNTLTYDFKSLDQKFDLVFIDGDHHYEMVKNDTRKVFQHLVHEKSVVVWHDYARNPETTRFEVLAGILDGSPASVHPHLFHVAHTLCAVYIPGFKGGVSLESPVIPQGAFKVEISFKKRN